MAVEIRWEWFDEPQMVVERDASGMSVRVHPGLSYAQVERACAELGAEGPVVMAAWQQASNAQGQID